MSLAGTDETVPPQQTAVSRDAPIVFLVMGMAGSGKTTFVHVRTLFQNAKTRFLCLAIDFLHELTRETILQHQLGSSRSRSSLSLQYRYKRLSKVQESYEDLFSGSQRSNSHLSESLRSIV